MGISHLADAVTGRYLKEDEEIVTIVIARCKDGYPDPVTHAALPITAVNQLFRPISLPIRGKVGSYSDFTPHPDQASVDLTLKMTETVSWEEFAGQAFNMDGGANLPGNHFSSDKRDKEVLGVWAVSAATWNELVAQYGRRYEREETVSIVMECFQDALESKNAEDKDHYFMNGDRLLQMDKHGHYEKSDGTVVDLPPMTSIMSGGWRIDFDVSFRRTWDRGIRKMSLEGLNDLRPALEGFYDVMAVAYGLDLIQKPIMPSPSAGQYDNSRHVADMALSAIDESLDSLLERAEDFDSEKDHAFVQNFLEKWEQLHEKFSGRFQQINNRSFSR